MMIDFAAWAWPQWAMLTGLCISLFVYCRFHGEDKGKYSALMGVANFAINFGLLYAGGFWS